MILLQFSKGCKQAKQSYKVYREAEDKHELATAIFSKLCMLSTVSTMTASAMFPISHAIFGYPPPGLWPLSIEIQ